MAGANIKRTYGLPPQQVDYLDRLSRGNLTTDTEVVRAGVDLLITLGIVGVGRSFIIKGTEEGERDKEVFIPKALDLQELAEPVKVDGTLPKEGETAKIKDNE